jgi:hypothetical protein
MDNTQEDIQRVSKYTAQTKCWLRRYQTNEEFRAKMLEYQKRQKAERYANDPEFRERAKQKNKERYLKKKSQS